MQPKFRPDNTQGWSEEDLAWMNLVYERRIADLDPESPTYGDECQQIAGEILDERYALLQDRERGPDTYTITGYEVREAVPRLYRGHTSASVHVPAGWTGKRIKMVRIDP